jgi:transcriptional regulator with XRE-family HTH domain
MKPASKSAFGSLLRKTRQGTKKTLGDLAKALDVSVVYVSDIERGNRAPFRAELIEKAADFLGVDARELLRAAAEVKGAFQVRTDSLPPQAREFVAGLARGEQHSESFWTGLAELIRKDEADVK